MSPLQCTGVQVSLCPICLCIHTEAILTVLEEHLTVIWIYVSFHALARHLCFFFEEIFPCVLGEPFLV